MNKSNRAISGASRPTQLVTRLSPEVYESIATKCQPLHVGIQTTELQTAFVLGQQSVLKMIRDDLVIHVQAP